MNLPRPQKILLPRLTIALTALWLIFRAPAIGPIIREQGWEHIPWPVPAAMAMMLICWLLSRKI